MRNKTLIIVLVLAVLFGGSFFFGMVVYLISQSGSDASIFSGGNVGMVTVEGGIYESKDIVDELDEYRKDDDIKAVVLRIESPGGTVAAAQELLTAVKRVAAKKPVVASFGSIAASGGYYIACGATKILANPGSITGSIGVRMDHVDIGNLLRWAKIGHETLKSGRLKDIASPDRPLTPEEKNILEAMLADIHRQFKGAVADARGLTEEAIDKIADGRIYSGEEAQKLGLVDQLGGISDAITLAGELAGIKGEPKVVEKYKGRRKFIERIFESATSELKNILFESRQIFHEPALLYWGY